MITGGAGGLISGVTDVAGFGVDTVMKVANFVGFKNIVSISVTAAGAMGGNEALTFAGIGSLIGGKSAIGTLVGAGAGFAIGSMMQADDIANEAAETFESDVSVAGEFSEVPESVESQGSTNRYIDNSETIDSIMSVNESPSINDIVPDPMG